MVNNDLKYDNLLTDDSKIYISAKKLIDILSTLNPKAAVTFSDIHGNELYLQHVDSIDDPIGKYTACQIILDENPKT